MGEEGLTDVSSFYKFLVKQRDERGGGGKDLCRRGTPRDPTPSPPRRFKQRATEVCRGDF